MGRAALAAAAMAAVVLAGGPAQADCGSELQGLRARLVAVKEGAVKDEARRQEIAWLVAKADKDAKAGRAKLCEDAVRRVRPLLQQP
jgi:hypothetical protein